MSDIQIPARALAKALLEAADRWSPPGLPISPRGNNMVLEHAGDAIPPSSNQEKSLIEVNGPAQEWIVSMRGEIQDPGPFVFFGPFVWPFTVFRVTWTLEGTSYTTFVDGYSDQYLTVFAQQIQVFGGWDTANFRLATSPPVDTPGFKFPKKILLQAAVSPGTGELPRAHRTFFIDADFSLAFDVPIPYAASSFILRTPRSAGGVPGVFLPTLVGVFQAINSSGSPPSGFGFPIDAYSAASIQAAHDRGELMSVASMADRLRVVFTAPPAAGDDVGLFCEFQLQP
jgi:hypothetical protein